MLVSETQLLALREQQRDLLREAEEERLILALERHRPGHLGVHRRVAAWLGTRLMACGASLQRYGTASPCCTQGC